jgi:multiple sugar transport system substrate-binding protein
MLSDPRSEQGTFDNKIAHAVILHMKLLFMYNIRDMTTTEKIELKGITWDHSRGFTPLAATAQRFHELHPEVQIVWSKRSLQDFADMPIEQLSEHFDLIVIDHPWSGFAANSGALLPLESHLPADFLAEQDADSVGSSHRSYAFDGSQWALAIDAAAPVSAYRPDLIAEYGGLPSTWDELIALGRKRVVACPSIALDVYGNFLNLCVSAGETIFPNGEIVVERHAGVRALEMLSELASIVPPRFFDINPIGTLEVMSRENLFVYCPFTYGYSNYARPGYGSHLLRFGDVVSIVPGRPGSTMLGGTGLAISAKTRFPEMAADYILFVATPETQRGLYFQAGGQPGLRSAWIDPFVNIASSNFFVDTLPSLTRAFVRPRYAGYLRFQDSAGFPIHSYLRDGGNAHAVLEKLNTLYRASKEQA